MNDIRRALVIGGGIAGPAVGLALRKAGIEPVVFEANARSANGSGAFLTIATNGIDALRALEADREVLSAGFSTPWITLRSGTGKYLGRTATGIALSDGTSSHTIKRSDLHRALHDQACAQGISIEYGKRLVDARREGDRVRALFADGSEEVGDVLIGCDGVRSSVRRLIDPGAPAARFEGLLTTGGYARGVTVPAEPGSYEMIFGARAFFGYVLAPDGEAWWFANVPSASEPARSELGAVAGEERRRLLLDLFGADAGPACALIDATEEIMPLSAIHTMPRLARWYRDRMIVVGDAAHAPSPTSGQGASLSIEDAAVLALALRDDGDAQTAFARFEAVRRPRVEQIVKWAARVNNSKAPGAVGRIVRDAMLPAILKLTAASKAQRMPFEHHVEWSEQPRPFQRRRPTMSKVLAEMSMSLDGYVADPRDGVQALHGWYVNGEVETPTGMQGFAFRTSAASAEILRDALTNTGAVITGRRNFDIAGGWGGRHPLGVPVFVVTHSIPDGWPRDDAPFTFVDSVEQAVASARAAANGKLVVIASPNIAQQALALGLLDEVAISLVPVLLGDGIPFFAKRSGGPIVLSDPSVVEGSGVTHLRFAVQRDRETAASNVQVSA